MTRLSLTALALALAAASAVAQTPTTTKKSPEKPAEKAPEAKAKPASELIVGKWSLEKTDTQLPPGTKAVMDFQKDGKLALAMEFTVNDKPQKLAIKGTYAVAKDGKTITTKMTGPDGVEKEETVTLQKLTADDLEVIDEKKQVDTFKRVKEEKSEEKK